MKNVKKQDTGRSKKIQEELARKREARMAIAKPISVLRDRNTHRERENHRRKRRSVSRKKKELARNLLRIKKLRDGEISFLFSRRHGEKRRRKK